ncbi:apolipoprotein N-acyltransferase [Shewanella sp. Isolate11]|uniref:apolipoprotein N-acyltransferase n=1 Tax=Shewanella sp. Isolate11 TaxID=2908530 RepID=UPI001EFD49A1|nr:apolipoprotein N-acyltransferase [Shewanella sp. Isolate11]MCG9697412.1 apolipoprotein N-acyltransferase [Shewanella sp. Isolate11]
MLQQLRAFAQKPLLKLVLAYLAGASTALSFAPYSIWPIYFIALAFALVQSESLTPRQAFKYWLSFGFGCFSTGISWLHVSMADFGGMPLIASLALMALLALYLALYHAISGMLLAKLSVSMSRSIKYLLLFPAIWVVMEWARGWVITGFPWLWAGYTQTSGPLSPLASIIGALGLSYIVVMFAGALALLFIQVERPVIKRAATIIVSSALLLLGSHFAQRLSPIDETGKQVRVTLVQGNIAQSMKWQPEELWPIILKYMELSRPHLDDTDIFIWPEAAIPATENMVQPFLDNANKVANLNDAAIITGIISRPQKQFYNSLIVLGNYNQSHQDAPDYQGNGENEFRKHHLVPVGEFVPLEDLLRPIAPFFNLPMSSFARGDYQQPNLNAVGHQLAPAICYEIVFPEQLRANVNDDTELLLTVSNDAWFGHSDGPLQHMEIAQMRAIELGRPLVRATNNGVTAVVNPQGKITDKLPQFETAVLHASIPLVKGETLFLKWGQWPVLILSWGICIIALLRQYRLRRHKAL